MKFMETVIAQSKPGMLSTANTTTPFWKSAISADWREVVTSAFPNLFSALTAGDFIFLVSAFLAQSKLGALASAFSTLKHWIATFPAKHHSIFGLIRTYCASLTALLAFLGVLPNLPLGYVVMINTKPKTEVWLAANRALPSRPMNQVVFGFAGAQVQIFNSIIRSNLVFVMHFFFLGEKSSKMLFHHNSVFPDIASTITEWMRRHLDPNVTVIINHLVSRLKIGSSFSHAKLL